MARTFRCPECGAANHLFDTINDGLLAIASERSLPSLLGRIVDAARGLVHASYAAIGVPDGEGGFAHFVTSGVDDATVAALGRTPRTHGVLGGLLAGREPVVTTNIQRDPRFGGWPAAHPDMKSFLGLPIVAEDEVVAAFYLANENEWGFTNDDVRLVEMLAPHAAIAISNAALLERSRELTIVQERNRLARDLHDAVTQSLFSIKLLAETVTELMERDPAEARLQMATLKDLARSAMVEMRSLIFELRPPELETDGLVATVRKHVDVLRRVYPMQIHVHAHGYSALDPRAEREAFRIVQEALNNALKHSGASEIVVEIEAGEDKVRASVVDDGAGFDPSDPSSAGGVGIGSMRERARAVGADLLILSRPGGGTNVTMEMRP